MKNINTIDSLYLIYKKNKVDGVEKTSKNRTSFCKKGEIRSALLSETKSLASKELSLPHKPESKMGKIIQLIWKVFVRLYSKKPLAPRQVDGLPSQLANNVKPLLGASNV